MATVTGLPGYSRVSGPGGGVTSPIPRATPEQFGSENWNNLYNLGIASQKFFNIQQGFAIDREHQEQSDRATEAAVGYQTEFGKRMAELTRTEGVNALDVEQRTQEVDEELRSKYDVSDKGKLAGRLYKKSTDGLYSQMQLKAKEHKEKQQVVYNLQNIDMMKQQTIQSLAANPGSFTQIIPWMETAVRNESTIKGWSPEKTAYEVEKAQILGAETVIQSLLMDNGGPIEAKKFLENEDWFKWFKGRVGEARVKVLLGDTVASVKAQADKQEKNQISMIIADTGEQLKNVRSADGSPLTPREKIDIARRNVESSGFNPDNLHWKEYLSDLTGLQAQAIYATNLNQTEQANYVKDTADEWVANISTGRSTEASLDALRTQYAGSPEGSPGYQANILNNKVADSVQATLNTNRTARNTGESLASGALINNIMEQQGNLDEYQEFIQAGDAPGAKQYLSTLAKRGDDRPNTAAENAAIDDKIKADFAQVLFYGTISQNTTAAINKAKINQEQTNKALKSAEIAQQAESFYLQNPANWQEQIQNSLNDPSTTKEARADLVEQLSYINSYTTPVDALTKRMQSDRTTPYMIYNEKLVQAFSSPVNRAALVQEVGRDNYNSLMQMYGVAQRANTEEKATKEVGIRTAIVDRIKGEFPDYNVNDTSKALMEETSNHALRYLSENLQAYDLTKGTEWELLVRRSVAEGTMSRVVGRAQRGVEQQTILTSAQVEELLPGTPALITESTVVLADPTLQNKAWQQFREGRSEFLRASFEPGVSNPGTMRLQEEAWLSNNGGKSDTTLFAEWLSGKHPFKPDADIVGALRKPGAVSFTPSGDVITPTYVAVSTPDGVRDTIQVNIPKSALPTPIQRWIVDNGMVSASIEKSSLHGWYMVKDPDAKPGTLPKRLTLSGDTVIER